MSTPAQTSLFANHIRRDICVGCYHYRADPIEGCWLGIPGRTVPTGLDGSRELLSRRRGRLPRCWRQRQAVGDVPANPRIGLLVPLLILGGAERWVAALATGLPNVRGVVVQNMRHAYDAIRRRIERVCPVFEGEQHFVALAEQCDVIITWGLTNLTMLSQFVRHGGRVINVGHGHCAWAAHCIRSCVEYCTDWCAVSRHAAASFPDTSRVTVIYNGIDTSRCVPKRSRTEVRAAWGLSDDEIAVGYVGRLSFEKRPIACVEAVAHLGKPYRAVLVGVGGMEWVQEARKLAPDTIYQPPVEDVGDIYRALDCFMLVSPSEGFSLALTEAWYCGCPTVATPVGGTEITKEHGPMYVAVPVGATAEQLADAVRRAISPENRPVVENAARVVAESYTEESMCARWWRYLRGEGPSSG